MTRHSPLSLLVDLGIQLEADAERDPVELHRRDRTFGREFEAEGLVGDVRIAVWLERVRPAASRDPGERTARALGLLTLALVVIGALSGAGTASALFTYDGSHPVNAVRVLAVFVVLQGLLVLSTGLLMLPEAWRRRVPGLAIVQDALSLLSPGRWQGLLRRVLPQAQRDGLDRALGLARAHGRLYGEVQRWTLLTASQGFGVAFHVGALASCLFLVTFTDLAFGWSTTLDVDVTGLHALTGWLALPWSGWLPDASPSLELVESTQYFRGLGHAGDPAVSAPWWRFLAAAMVTYGLIPRSVLLGFARWGRSTAVATAVRHTPGVVALLERFESELVETTAESAEPGTAQASVGGHAALPLPLDSECTLIAWSGLPLDAAAAARAAARVGLRAESILRGGEASLETDREVVRRAAAGEGAVAVLVKAWEPPVLEFVDFLGDLRGALGAGRPIVVLPVGVAGGEAAPPEPGDALQWQRRLDAAGDPWLSVLAISREEA